MMSKCIVKNSELTLDRFIDYCECCESVQTEVLLDIIRSNEQTAIGRKYNFSGISSIDDFRKNVPATDWTDYKKHAAEAESGVADQMFAGLPELFIITSGTTGQSKIIPESKAGIIIKNSTTNLRLRALLKYFPDIMNGKLLPMANSAVIGKTKCGIPYGTASGITLMNAPEKWRRMVGYPLAIMNITDADAIDYALMRFAIASDIRIIICNNAGRLELLVKIAEKYADIIIKDIEHGTISDEFDISDDIRAELQDAILPDPERAEELRVIKSTVGKFTPKEYWRELRVISCWLAGSVGRYVKRIRPLFADDVQFMDCGYGATEGKFNIPLELNKPSGPLAIHSGFFEFKAIDDNGDFLSAHQLKDGELYEVYCTTYSGLYRYSMHDIIKVEGFTGTTPNIRFESKAADFANICGEKLAPEMIMSAFNNAADALGISVQHWCLVVDLDNRCYNFCFELIDNELSLTAIQLNKLAELVEEELFGDGSLPYPVFRKQDLIMPAKVTLMKGGWHNAWFDSKKKSGNSANQIKLPLVCSKIPVCEYVCVRGM